MISPPSPSTENRSTDMPRKAAPLPAPMEWAIERWIKVVGRGPATLGRGLDKLATVGWLKPILLPMSSVWVGISLLFLIALYVGIGSGFASIRAHWEMTDLEFFDWWPMRILIALLAVNLSVVTLRRIPLTLYRVGVWSVHVGILTLLFGCVWYFSQKNEGSVRIFMNRSVGEYYDATERALYAYKLKPDGIVDASVAPTMTPLAHLPIYYEHLASLGNGMDRVVPGTALSGLDGTLKDATLRIVGYYPYADLVEEWSGGADNQVATTQAGEANPAVLLEMGTTKEGVWLVGNSPAGRVFDGPRMPYGIEYVYHPSVEKLADITADVSGPAGVTVRIPKLNLTKTFSVDEKPIAIAGTPYTLTVTGEQAMPLRSKGYEGAFANCLTVHVVRKEADGKEMAFDRMIVGRYPEISPDFIKLENGQQKRIQERVDNDIQLTFHDAQKDQIWVVEHDESVPAEKRIEIVHRPAMGGKVERIAAPVGKTVTVQVGKETKELRIAQTMQHAVRVLAARAVPVEQRERGQTAMDAMQRSLLEVELTRGDFKATRIYVPFVQFAQVGEPPLGLPPVAVDVPGVGKIGLLMSTTRRELPARVKLTDFVAKKYAGASAAYEDYSSTLELTDKKTGAVETAVTHLNEPAASQGLYFFQSAWGGENVAPGEQFSVLGVGNRPGLNAMLVGALLIVLGIGYAFYVKPVLLQKKKKWLANWQARRLAEGDAAGA